MKFYNIFKPHIVEFGDGAFAVRKFSVFCFGFVYKDASQPRMNYWWYSSEHLHHAKMKTFQEALELLQRDDPKKIKQVYYG